MSKLFKIEVDAEFYADDIDDAFARIARHFKDLADCGGKSESPSVGGIFDSGSRLSIMSVEDMRYVEKEK